MATMLRIQSRWLFSLAFMILLAGLLVAAWLFKQSRLGIYPTMIADAYRESQHRLTVPGSRDVTLTRSGAYGIYYEQSLISSSMYPDAGIHPEITCTLTSKINGATIHAVPDYVGTNRYRTRDLRTGILIMSVTVDTPGTYTFICNYQDGRMEPESVVVLGPNYMWEFLRVAWEIVFPFFGGLCILCGSLLLAGVLLVLGLAIKVLRKNSGLGLPTFN